MPPRDWRLRIEDMLDAADAIEKFVRGGDFDTFRRDRKTVDAVVRNLEVMGEAARHVPDSIRQKFADIPWADIVGMRSILIHEYSGIDFEILWHTVQSDVPSLVPGLKSILDQNDV